METTVDATEDFGDTDMNMDNDDAGELEELLVSANDTMDDEFNESVVTKIVVRGEEEQTRLTIDENAKLELYRLLDVSSNESIKNLSNWRLNVIHVRGVHEMSSEDVLSYFTDYMPNSIEWVNDISCNVVFDEDDTAASVMNDLKTAVVFKGKKYSEVDECNIEVLDGDSLELSVPPGRWLLAKPHSKAKILLLRFANLNDKKVKGARKWSQYYKKYGFHKENNTETDSDSMVQRFRQKINVENVESNRSNKVMRMRMRADDEEDKAKRRTKPSLRIHVSSDGLSDLRDVETTDNQVSIWNRLDVESPKSPDANKDTLFGDKARRGVWSRLNQNRTYEPITVTDLRLKISERRIRFKRNAPY